MYEFFRFILAGILNTALGFLLFALFFYLFDWQLNFSNFLSYAIVLFLAFFLNKYFVFKSEKGGRREVGFFIASALIAFIANQAVLSFSFEVLGLSALISQICGMVVYTVLFFALNKLIFR